MPNSKAYTQLIIDLQQSAGLSQEQAEAAAKTIRKKQIARIKEKKQEGGIAALIPKLVLGYIHAWIFFDILFDIKPNSTLTYIVLHTVFTIGIFSLWFLAWTYIPKFIDFLSGGRKPSHDDHFFQIDSNSFQDLPSHEIKSSFEHNSIFSDLSSTSFANSDFLTNPSTGLPMCGNHDICGNLFGHSHH